MPMRLGVDARAADLICADTAAAATTLDRACFDHPLRQDLITRGHHRAPHFSLERMGQASRALHKHVLRR